MSVKHVYLFRHGQTDWNEEGRFQGHIDIPLNEVGRAQARELGMSLKTAGIRAILSSDLSRARETAEIAVQGLNIPIFIDAGLREAHLGDAQGKKLDEIEMAFGPDLWRKWRSHLMTDADISYPGGESGTAVMNRAFAAVENFLAIHPEFDCFAISTHGGVIRRMTQKIRPPDSEPVAIPNAVIYQLGYDTNFKKWYMIEL